MVHVVNRVPLVKTEYPETLESEEIEEQMD